jgi:hypothetical protein
LGTSGYSDGVPTRVGLFACGAIALLLGGCRSIASLKQRCIAGELSACESACAKGVAGEGGCFHAGNQHREQAAQDFASTDFRRASEYFARSCDGGYAEGCLMSGEMIGAPYAPEPAAESQKPISDAEVRNREKRFDVACARGSSAGCKRLGDVLIGKNAVRANEAYAKACEQSSAPADCKTARANEVTQAEMWRIACTRRVADDCTRLGDLLYQVDPPRAVRLFASECQLRGVAALTGGEAAFVRDRIDAARTATLAPAATSESAGTPAHAFDVLSPAVDGPLAITEVLRAFNVHGDALARCIDLGRKSAPSELGLELIVDETGDTFRTRVSPAAVPIEVVRCLVTVTQAFQFGAPATPAVATLTLRVRDNPPAKPAHQ